MAKQQRYMKTILLLVSVYGFVFLLFKRFTLNTTIAANGVHVLHTYTEPIARAERIIYLYHSNFTYLYEFIHNNCEAVKSWNKMLQHMPDFYFFNALKSATININGTDINIVSNIEELALYPSTKQVIFVIPIWNDIFAAMFLDWHTERLHKSCLINSRKAHRIVDEVKGKMLEFEGYMRLHPAIAFKYVTIFHAWYYRQIWDIMTYPLYVKNNVSIIHYEKNVVEGMFGVSKLYGYKAMIVAPYLSRMSLLSLTAENNHMVYDIYFGGGIRYKMMGSTLRIKACKLNELKRVVVRYLKPHEEDRDAIDLVLKELQSPKYNWTNEQAASSMNCLQKHYISANYTDKYYLKDLKQSRFCLFFRGDSYAASRFYDIIYADCIPIIVSDEWLNFGAPFKDIIDYHRMCYFIKEEAFEQDPMHEVSKILQLKQSEWNKKLNYIKENKHHLIWVGNNSKVTHNIFRSLFASVA